MQAGGIANNKSNEIEAALSLRLVFWIWIKKNLITSKRGIPEKPGGIIFLLLRIINFTGKDVMNFRLICVSKCICSYRFAFLIESCRFCASANFFADFKRSS